MIPLNQQERKGATERIMAKPESKTVELDREILLKEFKRAYARLGDIVRGKTTVAEVANLTPEDLEALYRKAANALRVEDFSGAEILFYSLLTANGKDARAAMGLAAALEGQGRYEHAMPLYFLIVATTPYDPVAPFRAGICMMNLGKTEDAKKLFLLAAQCRNRVRDPAKKVYVDRAKGMLLTLAKQKN